jgi:hypothetical protein
VLWTTTYIEDALDALRADGYPVTDEAAGHLTPAQHDHIFYGTYDFDVESELRRQGHRPLVHQPLEPPGPRREGPDSLRC